MKKTIFAILLIVFGSFNLFAQSEVTQEEYDVYSNVLNSGSVLDRDTIADEDDERLRKVLNKLPKDLVADFSEKIKKSARIESKLKGFRFSDEDDPTWNVYNPVKNEIHFVLQKRQWVSRVGFSSNGKYALMMHSFGTDGLPYGATVLIWFVKKNNIWEQKKQFLISEY